MLPTVWVLPEVSRFVPPDDTARLRAEAGERSVVVVPNVGHSIHRDATQAFVDIVKKLGAGTTGMISSSNWEGMRHGFPSKAGRAVHGVHR